MGKLYYLLRVLVGLIMKVKALSNQCHKFPKGNLTGNLLERLFLVKHSCIGWVLMLILYISIQIFHRCKTSKDQFYMVNNF